ncbi:DUF697 domain-containing protein [Streptomyces asoensis]|uniref:DUF697 domain-containing protein n=1 Tax=Streptomyces asoensis TaxID=249586 RepID=UPI0037A12C57
MDIPDQSWVSRKMQDAAIGLDDPDAQSRAVIFSAVAINTGMGAVPFGINVVSFISVDVAMVVLVGSIYGCHYTNEQAAQLIKQILGSVTLSTGAYFLVAKLFAESAKAGGAAVLPFYVMGMSLDGLLCGSITYAIGFTSRTFFKREMDLSKSEMRREFKKHYRDGKRHTKNSEEDGP